MCFSLEVARLILLTRFIALLVVQPDVVIWVQGRAANPQRRSIIREILASDKAWPEDVRALFFFMVGRSNASEPEEVQTQIQTHLNYEFDLYGDIVQNDYIGRCKPLIIVTVIIISDR